MTMPFEGSLLSNDCINGECVASFFQDYTTLHSFCQPLWKIPLLARNKHLINFQNCLTQFFGPATPFDNGLGPSCFTDTDCEQFETTCNLFTHHCQVTDTWQVKYWKLK